MLYRKTICLGVLISDFPLKISGKDEENEGKFVTCTKINGNIKMQQSLFKNYQREIKRGG